MGKKLYVGNLPYSATEDSLKEAFSRFGTVESVTIITDRDTGQSKGFGFLELATPQEAASAITSTAATASAPPSRISRTGPYRTTARSVPRRPTSAATAYAA
mgnify:CR=1 FL=1